MAKFLTLEEFLTLKHPMISYHMTGEEWLFRYNLAKKSFEKYGNTPPTGRQAKILVSGFNTRMPSIKTEKDLNWLPTRQIEKIDNDFIWITDGKNRYGTERNSWWFNFLAID